MPVSPRHILTALAVALAAPGAVAAQAVVQPLPGTTDADRLGDMMRRIGANPRDVDALVDAGDLSMRLGDLSGAAALFARAEKVDPRNGRVKAGMASILVRSERPGEALRYFQQAESYGADSRRFAADRALAYDLIGQQDRAQRDYRVALRDAPDDETVRRYALSLGISGNRELALKQLDPLLLKTDRGAWRARAFILAMTNDVPGAEKIATTMMPMGMAQGLQPFFQRLPSLPAADCAFAVHFGEVHATPERIADARMTPALPMLGPDPSAPVMMAAVQQPVVVAPVDTKRDRRSRDRRERVALASAAPVRTPMQMVQTVPTQTVQAQTVQAIPAQPVRAPVAIASVQPVRASQPVPVPVTAQPVPVAPVQVAVVQPTSSAITQTPPPLAMPRQAAGALPASTVASMAALPTDPIVSRAGSTMVAAPIANPAATTPAVPIAAVPITSVAATTAATVVAPPSAAPLAVPPRPTRAVAGSEDSILARIVAGLSIPASELDVAPAEAPRPAAIAAMPETGARVVAEAKAKTERDATAKKIAAATLAEKKPTPAEKKAADKKLAADKKALADKKAAAEKKKLADAEAAEEKRIARANPTRTWVQVSTGATEGDLPKAWKNAKARAPVAFGNRSGWTTPWRATNRVLAGPFKTEAEARTFVNQLAKEGVSTFSFTSDPGQIITKLPAK